MKVCPVAVLLIPLTFSLLVGCATTKDVAHLQGQIGDLQQKVDILRGRVTSEMQQNWVNFETSLGELRQEIKILRANIEEDRDLLNKVANDLEALKKDYETKGSSLTKVKGEGVAAALPPSASTTLPKEEPKEDMEGAYQKAYSTFKKGDYPNALEQFGAFLSTYPHSEYADNAHYWIGECYHQQGDYERAIVAYEKVMKQYPKGDKVPSALLKQGFAFLDMGDRVNAKIIFNKVTKEYPRSPQAEIAAKKLKVLD
ncbi:MAG: tol-pal system protein YbgF [Deltaproteobacteria bacterium RBG_13_52_11]|nr:MAG: tol-pal system protein YbgF [Deltaproteobacteria bacterium RBG_13_52_11]